METVSREPAEVQSRLGAVVVCRGAHALAVVLGEEAEDLEDVWEEGLEDLWEEAEGDVEEEEEEEVVVVVVVVVVVDGYQNPRC